MPEPNGPLEQLSLHELLHSITKRLSHIEAALETGKDGEEGAQPRHPLVELMKVLFGSWPAFAFIALILFYVPVRDALNAIPAKVRSADEIGLPGGFALQSTIDKVAAASGHVDQAKVIRALSNGAIQVLLQAPRGARSPISFVNTADGNQCSAFDLPADQMAQTVGELESKELVHVDGAIEGPRRPLDAKAIVELTRSIHSQCPGHAQAAAHGDETEWMLNTPLPKSWRARPQLMRGLTARDL